MARTVTQVTTGVDLDGAIMLIAVCSDGTLWQKKQLGKTVLHQPNQSEQGWVQISNVPQT